MNGEPPVVIDVYLDDTNRVSSDYSGDEGFSNSMKEAGISGAKSTVGITEDGEDYEHPQIIAEKAIKAKMLIMVERNLNL